jgi:hypothetical protein
VPDVAAAISPNGRRLAVAEPETVRSMTVGMRPVDTLFRYAPNALVPAVAWARR